MTWHFPVDWKQWATRGLKKKARTNQWVWEIISESGKLEDPNNSLWVLLCYVAQDEFTPCFDLTINLLTFVAIACGLDSTKKVLKKKILQNKADDILFSIYLFFFFLSFWISLGQSHCPELDDRITAHHFLSGRVQQKTRNGHLL